VSLHFEEHFATEATFVFLVDTSLGLPSVLIHRAMVVCVSRLTRDRPEALPTPEATSDVQRHDLELGEHLFGELTWT